MNQNTLKCAIDIALKEKPAIDRYLMSFWEPLRIRPGDESKENVGKIFISTLQARGGPKLKNEDIERIVKEFNKKFDSIRGNLPSYSKQEAVDYLHSEIEGIRGVGFKIAAVFLKDVVYRHKIWGELTDWLYLPVDRHVKNILTERLGAFTQKELPRYTRKYNNKANQEFQKALDTIHRPRVEFDYFWWIGYRYCNYKLLCQYCPLKDVCVNKEFSGNITAI